MLWHIMEFHRALWSLSETAGSFFVFDEVNLQEFLDIMELNPRNTLTSFTIYSKFIGERDYIKLQKLHRGKEGSK